MENKFFMWYNSDDRYGENQPVIAPYCKTESLYYELGDLLKMNLSDSIKKRAEKAKIGTKIKVMYCSRNNYYYLKCITLEQVEIIKKLEEYYSEFSNLRKRQYKIESDIEELKSKLNP